MNGKINIFFFLMSFLNYRSKYKMKNFSMTACIASKYKIDRLINVLVEGECQSHINNKPG